jgi:hypothetical protein
MLIAALLITADGAGATRDPARHERVAGGRWVSPPSPVAAGLGLACIGAEYGRTVIGSRKE